MQNYQRSESRLFFPVRELVNLSLLIALQIILTRVFVIDLGAYRISLGSVATILAGLWIGPLAGGICGFTADILGCFLKGFVVNPFITLAAMAWGIIPALSMRLFEKKMKTAKGRSVLLCGSIVLTALFSSLLLTTAGLVIFLGYQLYAILPGRLVQTAVLCPCYCILTCMAYYSPLTAAVTGNAFRTSRHLKRE